MFIMWYKINYKRGHESLYDYMAVMISTANYYSKNKYVIQIATLGYFSIQRPLLRIPATPLYLISKLYLQSIYLREKKNAMKLACRRRLQVLVVMMRNMADYSLRSLDYSLRRL